MFQFDLNVKVLEMYRPGRFILTLFANEQSIGAQKAQQRLWMEEILGYRRLTVQMLRLQVGIFNSNEGTFSHRELLYSCIIVKKD